MGRELCSIWLASPCPDALPVASLTNNTDLTYLVLVGGSVTNYFTGSVYSASTTVGTNAFTTQISRSGNPVETILVRDNTPMTSATNRFLRLKVTTP